MSTTESSCSTAIPFYRMQLLTDTVYRHFDNDGPFTPCIIACMVRSGCFASRFSDYGSHHWNIGKWMDSKVAIGGPWTRIVSERWIRFSKIAIPTDINIVIFDASRRGSRR
jgi:hypothetical protein